jgi:hypothetical protein
MRICDAVGYTDVYEAVPHVSRICATGTRLLGAQAPKLFAGSERVVH